MMGWAIALLLLILSSLANAQFADSTGPELESGDSFIGGGVVGEADDYFISSTGTDPGDCSGGTQAAPWLTLQKANDCVSLEGADVYLETGSFFDGENLYVTWGTRTGTKPAIVDTYCESGGVAFRWADGATGCGTVVLANVHYDNEYGPIDEVVAGSACPNIPSSFGTIYTANSSASFDTAYSNAAPGDAVIVDNGTYALTGTIKNLTKSGTAGSPIYILAESLHGVDNFTRFNVSGDYQVIAGFEWTTSSTFIDSDASNVRFACNIMAPPNTDGIGIFLDKPTDHEYTEIDNNQISGVDNMVRYRRVDQYNGGTTKNILYTHIHHNDFGPSVGSYDNAAETIVMGEGYMRVDSDPDPILVTNGGSRGASTFTLIENNKIDGIDHSTAEDELITMKSSSAMIRNNCIINSVDVINNRIADNSIITGNWIEDANKGMSFSGRDVIYAFNYWHNNGGAAAMRAWSGTLGSSLGPEYYTYIEASDGIWQYNVFNNASYVLQSRQIAEPLVAHPSGTTISDNDIYDDGTVTDYLQSGDYTEAQWKASNTWSNNTKRGSRLAGTTCGDASLFDGPGAEGSTTVTVPSDTDYYSTEALSPPSWWD